MISCIRDANAYLKPGHGGVFTPSSPNNPTLPEPTPSPEQLAWLRQGGLSNQIYSSLVWAPLEARTTDDSSL